MSYYGLHEYNNARDGYATAVGKFVYGVKERVDHIEANQSRVEHYLAPLIKAQQAERLRRGQIDRAQRYLASRQDFYRIFEERLSTSSGAKRHLCKNLVANAVRAALFMRDQARDAAARDLADAEVRRLSRLESMLS